MGRKKKVYALEVHDYLNANGSCTVKALSEQFEVTRATMRKRIRELRGDGVFILHNDAGLQIVNDINEANANDVLKMGNWIIGEVVGFAKIGKTMKKPMIQVRRILKLTSAERKELKKALLQITRLIDVVEIDDELGEIRKIS